MKAAVWTDYGKMEIKEVPKPVIDDNEVLLSDMSDEDTEKIKSYVDNFVNAFKSESGESVKKKIVVPISVVITKTDSESVKCRINKEKLREFYDNNINKNAKKNIVNEDASSDFYKKYLTKLIVSHNFF